MPSAGNDEGMGWGLLRPAGVLRTLGLVAAALAAGCAWGAAGLGDWLMRLALASPRALPAACVWLIATGALEAVLPRTRVPARWRALALQAGGWTLGALCGGLVGLVDVALAADGARAWSWPGAVTGALLAAAALQWIYGHVRARRPAAAEAQLMELQARIRPHFLFNTLTSAVALVRLDPDAAESVLQDLAALFRAALEADDGGSASLADEAGLARRYLAIEQVRLGDRLHVSWRLDAAAAAARLPALTLQPVVENAVHHGVEPAPEGGEVRITSDTRLGKAVLEVANTLPPAGTPERPGRGMALANLRARLALAHDLEGSLQTREQTDAGGQRWFVTRIEVPLS